MKRQKCYLCESLDMIILKDRIRNDIKRNVLKCQTCNIVYLEPKETDLQKYYKGEYRNEYTPIVGESIKSKQLFDIRLKYQQERINRLKHILHPEMHVLDIGCSTGHFLYALNDRVSQCVGIEYNLDNAEFANKLGIKVYTEDIEKTPIQLESLDLITIFQAFEHIEDPVGFIQNVSKYLKPDGFLCIEVPNIEDALISLYKIDEYINFWFREPHIFNYSIDTLSQVLKKAGFIGELKTIQRYSFMNHMNWLLTKMPQKHMDDGMSKPKLIHDIAEKNTVPLEFNEWLGKVDAEYKELLNKHQLGDSILFIGKKK